jgi:type IV pilus assembly protein PilY1
VDGLPTIDSGTAHQVYDDANPAGFYVQITPKCSDMQGSKLQFIDFNDGCAWVKNPGALDEDGFAHGDPDCCEAGNSTCVDSCYSCVFDLDSDTNMLALQSLLAAAGEDPWIEGNPGERFLGKPLIAGGLIFITSYLPPRDPCKTTGSGFLHSFEYECKYFDPNIPLPFGEDSSSVVNFRDVIDGKERGYGAKKYLGLGIPSNPILDTKGEHVIVQMSDSKLIRTPVNLQFKRLKPVGWQERR